MAGDQAERGGVEERCPTCGCPVRVVTGGEGTSHYERSEGLPDGVQLSEDELKASVDAFEFGFGMAGGRDDPEMEAFRTALEKCRSVLARLRVADG